jgi:hypothetical protein
MRSSFVHVVLASALAATALQALPAQSAGSGAGPTFETMGPLAFSPDGVLFAADTQAAAIYALTLGPHGSGAAPGVKSIDAIDQKIAALVGADVRDIAITDLAVHPKSRNAFLSVMRGQGADAKPALLRVDGEGRIEAIALDRLAYSKATLPNPPSANPADRRNPRAQSITDMAFLDGRLYVAGLSNEEFSSKLRSVPYPFTTAVDAGASVEIYHGSHGQFETRSPVYTFVPYTIDKAPHLIAGYLCTPLVKFPVASLKPGGKVMGVTIAELGNRNRPLDMILYRKDGREYLLMSNNSRGVMKIAVEHFAGAQGITSRIADKAGVPYETVTSLTGVEQLDLLDPARAVVLARTDAGALHLAATALP